MSVISPLLFPISAESQAEAAEVRVAQPGSPTTSGSDRPGENDGSQSHSLGSDLGKDEVKVQMEPPGEIAVYKFLDQNGTLVLQVPPQQMLDLAQAIRQELAQEAAPKTHGAEGGKNNGN
jgi:hypothetical protein